MDYCGELSQIREEGMVAGSEGRKSEDNPYPANSEGAAFFDDVNCEIDCDTFTDFEDIPKDCLQSCLEHTRYRCWQMGYEDHLEEMERYSVLKEKGKYLREGWAANFLAENPYRGLSDKAEYEWDIGYQIKSWSPAQKSEVDGEELSQAYKEGFFCGACGDRYDEEQHRLPLDLDDNSIENHNAKVEYYLDFQAGMAWYEYAERMMLTRRDCR